MPGMTDYGSLKPEQLSSLQSILDDVCTNLDPISAGLREEVARKLLMLFKGGTRDPQLLTLALRTAATRLKRSA